MCYTGKCHYEDHMGDCQLRSHNIRKGLPLDSYPDDAGCIIGSKENSDEVKSASEEKD